MTAEVPALSADGANHALADRVRLRACTRRSQYRKTQREDRIVQALGEDRSPIMNQKLVLLRSPNYLSELLQRPRCAWVSCYVHVD